MAKPKVGDNVRVMLFGGIDEGSVIDYHKESDTFTVLIEKTKWPRVPYKLPQNFKGAIYIEKTI